MAVHIALLRGINLGSRNRVSMPDLREHLAELGYGQVRTVVQSGNIVLESTASAKQLAADLRAAIEDRFDVDTPVITRTAAQLRKVIAADPIPDAADDPKRYQVLFLDDRCPATAAQAIEAADIAPEQVAVNGREIYCWHVGGIQRSPLEAVLRKQLETTCTARNWNTVLKLDELASA